MTEADLIVHVRDIAHPDSDAQRHDVLDVLRGLGVIEGEVSPPIIEALNKIDLLPPDERAALTIGDDSVAISAVTGEGVDALRTVVSAALRRGARLHDIALDAGDGARLAWLHEHGEVIEQRSEEEKTILRVRLSETAKARFDRL